MNTPPIFTICKNNTAVASYLQHDGLFNLYMAGAAPQNVVTPYAVWQVISGVPANYLGNRPDLETQRIQIDVIADNVGMAKTIANAIEYAIETSCHIDNYNGEWQNNDTKEWISSFDVIWMTKR